MYKVVIGLETHCELNTKQNVFSNSSNIYTSDPNVNISPIDLGFPGILPTLNKESVDKALLAALALNCEIPKLLKFDRKNYFYPDLPKGYQITQNEKPIGINGYLMTNMGTKVLIHDIHLEEDTARLTHSDATYIDYNRAGAPLIEIVTEPCISSAEEALSYLESLRNMLIYCNLSEARADRGQIRCDVNVSIMEEDAKEFGTKVEMKNINSFANVFDAINSEVKRQIKCKEEGTPIVMETRRYDEVTKETYRMRDKVEAVDYKYFTEPNIPMIELTEEYVEEIRRQLPVLPYERKEKYLSLGISEVDSNSLVRQKDISDYFDELIGYNIDPKIASNWMMSVLMGYLNKNYLSISDIELTPKMFAEILELINGDKISSKQGKEILLKSLDERINPMELYKQMDLTQITDETYIRELIVNLVNEHPDLVEDYKKGKNVFNFFIGEVMKITKGKASPKIASMILKEEIDKR